MKPYLFLLLSAAALSSSAAVKLSGSPIGTQRCVDYATGQESYTEHTVETLFDGDFDTYFATYDRSYTWGGLDLGTPHVIERVGWAPRNDYWEGEDRVKMAVIQGANSPDWLDAVPLYIITEKGTVNKMTYGDVDCSKGFRYVRYVSPSNVRCNLAELEFYGHEGMGDESRMFQFSNLPTVIINTVDSQEPYDKEHDITCNIIMLDKNTYDVDAPGTVRERGNSSRTHPKKPWRIKFDKKQNVLDAPAKAKKWTLINNHSDKTLMRNIVAFEISRRMGLEFTPYCQPVDVVLNGEFKGCYQLCDQVEVNKDRVPVTEMEETDIEGEALTGGYHFEVDDYASQEPEGEWFLSSRSKIPVTIKSPDNGGTPEQYKYISDYFSRLDTLVTSRVFSTKESGYRSMLNLDSYLRYFICQELIANADVLHSVHMYKKRGDDRICVGPMWDSELAFDNDSRVYPSCNMHEFVSTSGRGPDANGYRAFHSRIFLQDELVAADRSRLWSIARNEHDLTAESLCAYIDGWAEEMKESAELNFKRWNVLGQYIFTNPRAENSFEEAVENLKTYIRDRIAWLDDPKYLNYDPEMSSVLIPEADSDAPLGNDVIQSGGTLTLESGREFKVYTASGQLCYQGAGISPALAPGIYIIVAGDSSVKIVL